MGEFFQHGQGMTWGPAEGVVALLARHSRMLVRVLPAHPANAVKAIYAFAGGPDREARGYLAGLDPATGAQIFALDLPDPPAGLPLHWRPVLMRGGQVLDPKRGGLSPDAIVAPPRLVPEPAPPRAATIHPQSSHPQRFPFEPQFLFRVTAPFKPDETPTGETPDGLRFYFGITEGGTVRGPALNGDILHEGGDWMRVRTDGIGVAAIDAVIRPDSGGVVLTEYAGLADFGPNAYAVLKSGDCPRRIAIRFTPRYLTAIPSLQWINRLQGFAIGEANLDTCLVEYDMYGFGPGNGPR